MVTSGKLRENQAKVLAALVREPGSTYAEIAELAGLAQPEPARRLPELRERGLVFQVKIEGKPESRECTVRKTMCGVWRPTGLGMAMVEDDQ